MTGYNGINGITRLYTNTDGKFIESRILLPDVYKSDAAFADYDNDGDLDILISGCSYGDGYDYITKFYRNNSGSNLFQTKKKVDPAEMSASTE
jgi:hypothetical protein